MKNQINRTCNFFLLGVWQIPVRLSPAAQYWRPFLRRVISSADTVPRFRRVIGLLTRARRCLSCQRATGCGDLPHGMERPETDLTHGRLFAPQQKELRASRPWQSDCSPTRDSSFTFVEIARCRAHLDLSLWLPACRVDPVKERRKD
jgi:hypothetical protein